MLKNHVALEKGTQIIMESQSACFQERYIHYLTTGSYCPYPSRRNVKLIAVLPELNARCIDLESCMLNGHGSILTGSQRADRAVLCVYYLG